MSKKLSGLLLRTLIGAGIFIVVAFFAGVAAGWLKAHGVLQADHAVLWLVGVIAVVSMAGSMVISVAWMRAIDEAAREAHKAAWFWGGCGGMAVGGVFIILASAPQAAAVHLSSWFGGRTDPAAYAATGAGAMVLLMTAGYTVAWAWWWWKRR